MMNYGFGFTGIVSSLIFGAPLNATGSWTAPFFASIGLLLLGVAQSFFV